MSERHHTQLSLEERIQIQKGIESGKPCMKRACRGCPSICNPSCPGYSPAACDLLMRPPYVCNACRRRGVCQKDRFFYDPLGADRSYRETLSSSRSGISISEDERQRIGSMLHDGLSRGLSLHQIISGVCNSL